MSLHADVVVIGGGISGLAAAHSARKLGASVLVLEASASVGGVMQTDHRDDFVVEHGPTSMAATTESMALIDELGLTPDVIEPPKTAARRYVVRDGKMCALPSSPASLVRSDLLSAFGKLRLLAEPFVGRNTNVQHEESLAEIVRRRFGQEVLDYFVDPFVSGVCAGAPEKLSSRHVLRMIADLETEHGSVLKGAMKRARNKNGKRQGHIVSFKRGMSQLPEALKHSIGPACISDAAVHAVTENDNHFELSCNIRGVSETVFANSIIVALPSHVLPSIAWPAAWQNNLAQMAGVNYAPIATVALGFRREYVKHPLDGFGVLMPSLEKRGILGALFNSSMFEGRAPAGHVLLTAFVGGARNARPGASLHTDSELAEIAIGDLTGLLGVSGAPALVSVAQWPLGIPQLEVGHHRVIAAAAAIENVATRAFFTGSYLSGAAVGDCLAHGALSGARAAAQALQDPLHFANILAQPHAALL